MAGNQDEKFIDIDALMRDLSKADPLADSLAKRVTTTAKGLGVTPLDSAAAGAIAGGLLHSVLAIVTVLISIVVKLGSPLIVIFLRVLTKFRTETIQEQVEISAAVVSEFLAAEVKPEHIKTGKGVDETIAAAQAIGASVIDRLTVEFAPEGTVTPESGEKAAKTFTGYAVNFGVQNAMLATIADAVSVHLLGKFQELGVEVARNMGLGRLVRQALIPLIRNTIGEPYDQALRKRYRPDLLSEQHAVDAFFGGFVTSEVETETLARKGYSDDLIRVVETQLRKKLNADELETLQRAGVIGPEFAKAELRAAGYDDVKADQKLQIQRIQRTDSLVTTFKSLITKQRIDGLIDEDAYNKLLDRLPISDEEKQLERDFVGASLEVPRSFLPWSEVKKAFELGAIDLNYVDAWLQREGFSDDDALVRELLLFDELGKKVAKEQAAADKATRKAAPKALQG